MNGARNWQAVSRTSRSSGEKTPPTASNTGPTTVAVTARGRPAASAMRLKNRPAASGSAAGRCQTCPGRFGAAGEDQQPAGDAGQVPEGVGLAEPARPERLLPGQDAPEHRLADGELSPCGP